MNPEAIALALQLLQLAVNEEPEIATDLGNLFKSGVPTSTDWSNLHNLVAGETYGQFVPQSDLPKTETQENS